MVDALRKGLRVQIFKEAGTAWGVSGSATAIFAGANEIRYGPDDTVAERDDLNGILTKSTGGTDLLGTAGKVYIGGYASYQDFPYILEGAYRQVTPTSDGGTPAAYTRVYSKPGTAQGTPRPMSLEAGGLTESFLFAGSVVNTYKVTGAIKGYTMFTSQWLSKDMVSQAFTPGLSRRSVTRSKSQRWTVAMDTAWANLGNTPITSCVQSIDIDGGDLNDRSNCINGATTPTGIIENSAHQETITLTVKLSAETLALFADYRAGTVKYLRLKNLGEVAIHDTTYPMLQLDVAAYISNWAEVGQAIADNALTIPIVFKSTWDETGGHDVVWTSVSSVSALP